MERKYFKLFSVTWWSGAVPVNAVLALIGLRGAK